MVLMMKKSKVLKRSPKSPKMVKQNKQTLFFPRLLTNSALVDFGIFKCLSETQNGAANFYFIRTIIVL